MGRSISLLLISTRSNATPHDVFFCFVVIHDIAVEDEFNHLQQVLHSPFFLRYLGIIAANSEHQAVATAKKTVHLIATPSAATADRWASGGGMAKPTTRAGRPTIVAFTHAHSEHL